MREKTISSKKKLTQLNVPARSEKCIEKEVVKVTNSKPHQHAKVLRPVKLSRLKLEDLVAQVPEENEHKEISTGPAVGNEVW